jgi:AcrR family transcriptional regulator
MKVTKDRQDEIRKKLIEAAIDLITEKGFQNATMREIASKAGVGSATVYNYFPTKEKILYAYFLDKHHDLISEIEAIPDFDDYSLKEKFQTQIETLLSLYLGEREFVQIAYKMMFDSPLRTFTEFTPVREMFTETAMKFIDSAIEKNEIMEHPLKGFTANIYWDYSGLILLYWLKDESEGFSNTTQLIDMSLDVIVDVLKSGVIIRMVDIASFLFRSHIYSNFQRITGLFNQGEKFREFFKAPVKDDDNTQENQVKPKRGKSGKRGQAE